MLLPENGHAARASRNQVGRGETVVEDGTHADVGQPVDLGRNVVRGGIAFLDTDEVVVSREGWPNWTDSRLFVEAIAEGVDPAAPSPRRGCTS